MEQTSNDDFIAKESKVINIIFGLFFLFLLLFAISNASFTSTIKKITTIILSIVLPVIFFWVNASKRKPVFIINSNGLFYYHNLITNWFNFQSAYIDALKTRGAAPDQFVLIVYYSNPDDNKIYQITLKISITLDKSHQEIMSAIEKYSTSILE